MQINASLRRSSRGEIRNGYALPMMNKFMTAGFTIVELMVTLAVAAILIGFAVPAFNDFIVQRTMASRVNDFVLAVSYARSEAIRRAGPVTIQALSGDNGNEWGEGYCVVVGTPGNCDDALRLFPPIPANEQTTFDATGNGWHGVYTHTFNARGMLAPQPAGPGTIQLCTVGENPGREVNITVIGRPDVDELVCP